VYVVQELVTGQLTDTPTHGLDNSDN